MITKMTKKQEALMRVYRDKWIKIGLSTENVSKEETKRIMDDVYTYLLNKKTVPIVICDNPIKTWDAVCKYTSDKNLNENSVRTSVRNSVWNSVENSVRNSVGNSVGDSVWNSVWNSVGSSVGTSVRNSVWNSVGDSNKVNFIYPYLDGNFMASYFSFYDFMQNAFCLFDDKTNKLFDIHKETSKLSLIYPFDDICFVCKKPSEIHLNSNNQLHNEIGAAIKYEGGFEIYKLNGVTVDKKVVMTSKDKITVNQILKEPNVEIRRELLRKVGIEDFIKKSKSKCIDKSQDGIYELYKVKISQTQEAFYLKMKNPSLENTYHFEGVIASCDTIEKALAWRDSEETYIKPIKLT